MAGDWDAFYDEYNHVRDQRTAIKNARFNAFLIGYGSGMITLLGLLYALKQFGIVIW